MNHSISSFTDKRGLDADIVTQCRRREEYRLEILKVELEVLREKVRRLSA